MNSVFSPTDGPLGSFRYAKVIENTVQVWTIFGLVYLLFLPITLWTDILVISSLFIVLIVIAKYRFFIPGPPFGRLIVYQDHFEYKERKRYQSYRWEDVAECRYGSGHLRFFGKFEAIMVKMTDDQEFNFADGYEESLHLVKLVKGCVEPILLRRLLAQIQSGHAILIGNYTFDPKGISDNDHVYRWDDFLNTQSGEKKLRILFKTPDHIANGPELDQLDPQVFLVPELIIMILQNKA